MWISFISLALLTEARRLLTFPVLFGLSLTGITAVVRPITGALSLLGPHPTGFRARAPRPPHVPPPVH